MDQLGMTIEVRAPIWVHGHLTRYIQMLCSLPFLWDEQRVWTSYSSDFAAVFPLVSIVQDDRARYEKEARTIKLWEKAGQYGAPKSAESLAADFRLERRVMHSAQLMRRVSQLSP